VPKPHAAYFIVKVAGGRWEQGLYVGDKRSDRHGKPIRRISSALLGKAPGQFIMPRKKPARRFLSMNHGS
jgi:hypothetical protein